MERTLRDSENSEAAEVAYARADDTPTDDTPTDDTPTEGEPGEAKAYCQADSHGGSAATTSVISRKELGRQLRRQAYQKAKAYRAKDPKYLALKETAKLRRRELYQRVKQSRKDASAAEKTKRSESRAQAATHTRQVREQEQAQRKDRQAVPKRQRMGELMQKLSSLSSSAAGESSPNESSSPVSSPSSFALAEVPAANDVS
jgi:hypothetical protein